MTNESLELIQNLIHKHKIMVFMKGSRMMPSCGFSNTVVQILNALNISYETYDVLQDPEIRQAIKEYSHWPTFPQLYVNGEFLGGADIVLDWYQSGELQTFLEVALAN
uniref:Glutaredoxin n=1 Tax=Sciadococcus taiwanensis TaxID=3028030 RepID=A0A9Y1MWM9_9RHOD|nr:Grx4 family monothiol glutaredoxin [Sciadococcus taiwanensis]